MADLDTQIAELKLRLAAAQRARIKAEHDRDAAAAAATRARTQLAEEFGVSTVADARSRLAELEHDLVTAIAHLRAALDTIGA